MSKVAFTKLNLKKVDEEKTIKINDQEIIIKQYLPINDKADLVARVLMEAHDENNFSNPIKIEVIGTIEIIRAYTNISFTEKQLERVDKLYDLFEENNYINLIIKEIPENEYNFIIKCINETIDAFYAYRHSALGIMETMTNDYSQADLDASKIQEKLANKENVAFLKEVLDKLG